ncbi:MAG: hypothetical protein EBR14_04405 [Methylophilaceae bacterium]|nr:hypothetical protein [Methylophilaceae bacterium]
MRLFFFESVKSLASAKAAARRASMCWIAASRVWMARECSWRLRLRVERSFFAWLSMAVVFCSKSAMIMLRDLHLLHLLLLLVLGSVTYFSVLWALGIRVKDFMKRTVI